MAGHGVKRTIACPRCDRVLEARWYRGVWVEVCGTCRGILVDRAALDELGLDTARLWGKSGRPQAEKTDCPICSSSMIAITAGGIALDRCDLDSVIWFDGEELTKSVAAVAKRSNRSSGVGQFLQGLASLFEGLSY